METQPHNRIAVFLILTFGLSSIFYTRLFFGASLATVAPLLMWTPGVAAVATRLLFDRTFSGLGWRLGRLRYTGMAIVIPLAYCLIIYVPVWLTGVGRFDGSY